MSSCVRSTPKWTKFLIFQRYEQTDGRTDRQTDRQTDTDTHRQHTALFADIGLHSPLTAESYNSVLFCDVDVCFNTSLKASAPAKFIFNISCILLLLSVLLHVLHYDNIERVLMAFAAPCAWSKLLFFARYVRHSIQTVERHLSSSY